MPEPLVDLSRLAIHTRTTATLSLAEAAELYAAQGVPAISVWRDVVHAAGLDEAGRILRGSGLAVPALVRGGFFVAADAAARVRAVDDNLRCIDEAAALGAEMVVLVVGSAVGVGRDGAEAQLRDALAQVLPRAQACGVRLAIEPLHPMYAADKSFVVRLGEANDLCDALAHPSLGVVVDVYHTWWDACLADEIARAGRGGRLFGFHLCDWRVETRDLLLDRGLMGEGCIDLRGIRSAMDANGFRGWHEVEIFSRELWALDPAELVRRIRATYLETC